MAVTIELGKAIIYNEELPPIKSQELYTTWPEKFNAL